MNQNTNQNDKDIEYKNTQDLLVQPSNKITDWKKEPSASDLMSDYTQAQSSQQFYVSKIQDWLKLLHTETDATKIKKGRSGIAPKVIRRLAEWRYSALSIPFLNEKKLFQVNASAPEHIAAAFQHELILNHQLSTKMNKVKFINDFVRTAVNEGTVCVRIGWETEYQTKETEVPVYDYYSASPEEQQQLYQILSMVQQEQQEQQLQSADETSVFQSLDPVMQESVKQSAENGMAIVAVDTGKTQIQKEEVLVKNQPAIEVIDTASLTIDPTCNGDFSKARFVVYTYTTSLSELKQDGSYKLERLGYRNLGDGFVQEPQSAEDILNLPDSHFDSNNPYQNSGSAGNSFKFKDLARKRLTAYEYWGYWDIDGTGIVQGIVATIVNGIIIKLERNPFPDGKLPFVVIPYMPIKGSVYGEPDAELVKDNQQIIQALTRSMIDINARSANGQIAIPKGFLDTPNLLKFRTGEDYEYNPSDLHPSQAIFMHTANEIPQSIMALLQSQYAEAESATGVKAFQNGIDGNAYGQVVAGMSQAITAMTQRESDIIFRLTKGLEEIGNKCIAMNCVWLSDQEVIEITQDQFITIKKEDLQGNFYLNVSVKSNNEAEGKAQQLTFLMQTLGNNIPFDMTKMFLMEIGRLYNLDNMVQAIKAYEPQPDPFQQQMQQLQLQEQQAKIQKLMDEAEYYRSRSAFVNAQVGNVQADTDQKNLEFLEQQDGVKHARQREIVEAQAKEQNKGKMAQELLKANSAERVAAINARAKANSSDSKKEGSKAKKNSPSVRARGIPNPLRKALPEGLYIADGLGNYVAGDGFTVGNQS